MINRIRKITIADWYYVRVALGYVATLAFSGMRPGVFAAVSRLYMPR